MNKKDYYSNKNVAVNYSSFRYSGRIGQYVNSREISTIKCLLQGSGCILDIPSGNGRLLSIFDSGHKVVGVDYSKEMLDNCNYKKRVLADAIKLPFKSNVFDTVLSIRFFFHYKDIFSFLEEFARVIKKDGIIIFETHKWSPRQFINIEKLGGKIYPSSKNSVQSILECLNLSIVEKKEIFLFSPFVYKYMPYFFIRILDNIEKILPRMFMVDVYWKVRKK